LNFQATIYSGTSVSYDPTENRIYWWGGYGDIYRAFLNGSSSEPLIRQIQGLRDIKVDLVGRNIYYSQQYANAIRVSTLDGFHETVLLNVASLRGITLDSFSGYELLILLFLNSL